MGNENFMRRYIMKCGKMANTGFQIGNIDSAEDTALHVCFSIEKSNAENPNDAKVQIWNLSTTNLKILETDDCIVELRAGYGDNIALVLVGNVTNVITTLENGDRMTELTVVDGMAELRDTTISISLNGKVNSKEVYKKIANEMGMSIVFANDLSFKTMPNGFTYVGKAKNALHKLATYCGHNWTIQNQVLQITRPGRAVSTKAYVLSSETGLINIPKRITTEVDGVKKHGWEVMYLLNGVIGINDVVQLKSNVANGNFLVSKVTIDGDNLEGDWICTAELVDIPVETKLDAKATTTSTTTTKSTAIKKGDKVKVTRTIKSGSKTKGYQYTGGTFVCWYDVYDVIQVNGDRVVIGIGKVVTAAVNIKDLTKV